MTPNQQSDKAKHGKRYDTGPSLSVAVGDCRGGWNGGHFSGDPALVEHAKLAAEVNAEVVVYGATLTADADTALGAYAALASYSPGRVIIYGETVAIECSIALISHPAVTSRGSSFYTPRGNEVDASLPAANNPERSLVFCSAPRPSTGPLPAAPNRARFVAAFASRSTTTPQF